MSKKGHWTKSKEYWDGIDQEFGEVSTQVHWPEEHQSEERLVADIHAQLLGQMQYRWLSEHELGIADLLNGRYDCGLAEEVEFWFFADWNSKIGRPCFGHELFESLRKETNHG